MTIIGWALTGGILIVAVIILRTLWNKRMAEIQ